jgi:Type IV secretory system Conjugative DNA transfer
LSQQFRSNFFEPALGRLPRSGRGGRRFKSCHSDQHLAEIKTLTGTDCGTVSGFLIGFMGSSIACTRQRKHRLRASLSWGRVRPAFSAIPMAFWMCGRRRAKMTVPDATCKLRIWGSGVRISSGAGHPPLRLAHHGPDRRRAVGDALPRGAASDISWTKPLISLLLNQIGRRLTEELYATDRRHRVLLMLDEFPALGRLDYFFESALAFMAGYRIKSFLIAQSLNQIEKAYGPNNSILDNCHLRVCFTTNDGRTAKCVSDVLGVVTDEELCRPPTVALARPPHGIAPGNRGPLLTAGEVMQLPPVDELVPMSGVPADPREEGAILREPAVHRA